MGANKYRKGIRNSSVNSVNNQADSRNWPRSSESPKVTPGVAGGARDAGVGVGWAGHSTSVHGRAGLDRVG